MANRELSTVEGENFHPDVARDADLDAHTGNLSNPHSVTAAQLGLSGLAFSQKLVSSANYTITDDDGFSDIDFITGASNRTCTLPTVGDNLGRTLIISKIDSGAGSVAVNCEGAEVFLTGDASLTLSSQGETLAIRGSSTGWKLF